MACGSVRRATRLCPVRWILASVASCAVAQLTVAVLVAFTIPSVVGTTTTLLSTAQTDGPMSLDLGGPSSHIHGATKSRASGAADDAV